MTDKQFTTSTVHADRKLTKDSGAVHYPIHNSVLFGYDNPQDLVDIFQGKQAGHRWVSWSRLTSTVSFDPDPSHSANASAYAS